MNFVVGLTGGIGSGKSTVADLLVEHGARLVDTDRIAHELTGPGGAAIDALRTAFGPEIVRPDGALDRGAMRGLIFADKAAKQRLEAILHPLIGAESARRCAAAGPEPYVVLAVPLLVESNSYRQRADRILVIDCDEASQIQRVRARSGLSEGEVRAIIAAQASREGRQRLVAVDVEVLRLDALLASHSSRDAP